jgi:predicted DNA-binding protein/Zn ribbon nucleic-acid-binding protein
VHSCREHGIELIRVEGDGLVCPRCEADDVQALLRDGQAPPVSEPADWVVPTEAEHEPRHLRPVTMRLDIRDVERAKMLSRERGMPYQRYLRELITRALDSEEQVLFGVHIDEVAAPATLRTGRVAGAECPAPPCDQL